VRDSVDRTRLIARDRPPQELRKYRTLCSADRLPLTRMIGKTGITTGHAVARVGSGTWRQPERPSGSAGRHTAETLSDRPRALHIIRGCCEEPES
jgi:hypothetical protein